MSQDFGALAELQLALRGLRLDVGSFHLIHYRSLHGVLATGKHSGSHWLKWMLTNALAHQYGVPPPAYSTGAAADAIVGHPSLPWNYPGLPRIGHTHTIPSRLVNLPMLREIKLPRVVVLVRDIPEALVSHYIKRVHRHGMTLSQYAMRPAPGRRRGPADAWWYINFFNRWGAFAAAHPEDTLIVRYEDMQADVARCLRRVADHFQLNLSADAIEAGLAVSGRDAVKERLDPHGREIVVPAEADRKAISLSAEAETFLREVLASRLRYDFGYGYRGAQMAPLPAGVWAIPHAASAAR